MATYKRKDKRVVTTFATNAASATERSMALDGRLFPPPLRKSGSLAVGYVESYD